MAGVKGKSGRKRWKPTKAQIDRVSALAGIFASDAEMYRDIGVGKDTWYLNKEEYFTEIIANSRMKTQSKLKTAMLDLALKKGSFPAIQSALKAKCGWDENAGQTELVDKDLSIKFID